MTRTAVGGTDPNEEWARLLVNQPDLWPLALTGAVRRFQTINTNMNSSAVVTADGNLGLWLKLTPFQAAAWHLALQHAMCPEGPDPWPDNPDDSGLWDDHESDGEADEFGTLSPEQMHRLAEAHAHHNMALHFLGERMAQWLVPMRQAFLELGWDELLESHDEDV